MAYAKAKHRAVNHKYGGEHEYEYHLEMVYEFGYRFQSHLPEELRKDVLCGCWVHDIIEDARETYNDVKQELGETVAELAYALTNEKGRNRKERASTKYYEGIRQTPGAVFIKICDRLANASYSKGSGGSMYKKYQKENSDFERMLGRYTDYKHLEPMFQELDKIFNLNQ